MTKCIHICLPVLNEFENLPRLLASFQQQSYQNFKLFICVNQPEDWWDRADYLSQCLDNERCLQYLNSLRDIELHIIDRSSRGNGWTGKKRGVGWARKLVMDFAAEQGSPDDILLSVDADTEYPQDYFQSLIDIFHSNISFTAHSNPYYHKLTGKLAEDRAILRYEIYMRVYAINMILIDNPYAFSAVGSAMATTITQYQKMGGISPKSSGEDFYFLQYMRKNGPLSQFNTVKVYPQARFSDRVNFGTGPAMIKGDSGDWSSYPFYPPLLFSKVKETFDGFEKLFEQDYKLPMTSFLKNQLKKENPWEALRKNHKTIDKFVRACFELVDGLRILQFLKESQTKYSICDVEDLKQSLLHFAQQDEEFYHFIQSFGDLEDSLEMEKMKVLRDELTKLEYKYRSKPSFT